LLAQTSTRADELAECIAVVERALKEVSDLLVRLRAEGAVRTDFDPY
jgi:hypothetical protein